MYPFSPESTELKKSQQRKFAGMMDRLVSFVEKLRGLDDYSVGRTGDGLFAGDDISQSIEFVVGDMTYTLVLTASRNDRKRS